jgi:ribonuclease HI
MNRLQIFTDGSVHTQLKVGYGAYLMVADLATPIETLKEAVKVKRFEQTSSTRLELQTLLWALHEAMALSNGCDMVLTVYTDSQNIIGLPGRCAHLVQSYDDDIIITFLIMIDRLLSL